MSQHPLISFQRHLQAQGKRPGTQDRYVSILAQFLRETDVPATSITADHAYDFPGGAWQRARAVGVVVPCIALGYPDSRSVA